ncbi:type II CRISPR-associated endonuclease Cas1 [Helicobacter sp. MIT 14-3879]|uniref:type II CRISPR-associated endonuclease Cas1 n=1 Tax=Helicobacter sp. MIT 14-3879 TaxID=2040649 RepID=UPI000E1F71F9|nr:type II CRISPR-associated endonuclease Cas1 [Helicobacter sp. MIT 14-3879]RDU64854.1 type II CRISPR-associated endonuclease Cas1 [Helicobacter sp. MIT 14-3879]
MFDTAFRTLFLSTPAKLSLADKHLCITKESDEIKIPLSDILCIILESHQITLTNALINALALNKIIVYTCDSSHLPSGIFMPFLGHYKSSRVLETQLKTSKQQKSILWQQIIKAKIDNQARFLAMLNKAEVSTLQSLAKSVYLGDSSNNEAKAAAIYFKALFGRDFSRKTQIFEDKNIGVINAALNYGYAIVRGAIVRSLCASGLNPALGIFHANQFNPFNLADDLIEPYRIFVDSLVEKIRKLGELDENLSLENRLELAEILSTQVCIGEKYYPLYRAVIASVQSLLNAIGKNVALALPCFEKDKSNGREIYESASDV